MATIVMESAKVIEAARDVISRIQGVRRERDEKYIVEALKPYKKWFKVHTRTREEAIEYLDKKHQHQMFEGWRSIYAWGTLAKAQDLLKLAQYGDPVTLNEKDIDVLF